MTIDVDGQVRSRISSVVTSRVLQNGPRLTLDLTRDPRKRIRPMQALATTLETYSGTRPVTQVPPATSRSSRAAMKERVAALA